MQNYVIAKVLSEFPHPVSHRTGEAPFTQSLELVGAVNNLECSLNDHTYLMETSGLDLSYVRLYENDTHMKVSSELSCPYFAEGSIIYSEEPNAVDFLIITWTDGVWLSGRVYCDDSDNLKMRWLDEGEYLYEGWGLAQGPNGRVYSTDGSSSLHVFESAKSLMKGDPAQDDITITCNGKPVYGLNELHYHSKRKSIIGMLYMTDHDQMMEINPITGACISLMSFDTLRETNKNNWDHVFNGVTLINEGSSVEEDIYLVTGKLWDRMYVVQMKSSI